MSKGFTDFTEGSISKHLIAFTLPMLAGNALQALYNMVDSFWVGRFLGAGSLAAVSVSFPIIFALISLVLGVTMATTTLVAQYFGAKDEAMVRNTVNNSITLLFFSAVFISVVGIVLRVPILRLVNTPDEILPQASGYLLIFLAGLVFMFLYNVLSAIFATSALVGQNLGAGKQERVSEVVRSSLLIVTILTLPVVLLAVFTPQVLLGIFTRDQAVLDAGGVYLRIAAVSYLPFAWMFVYNGVLRGAGDTLPTLLITIGSLWLVRVPLARYLSNLPAFGVRGIWWGIAISPVFGLLFSYGYYLTGRWKKAVVSHQTRQRLRPAPETDD